METELHSTLEVSSEQGLCDEPIHIWEDNTKVFHVLLNVTFNHTSQTSSRNVKLLPWLGLRLTPVSAGVGAGASMAAFGTGDKNSAAMDSSWTGVFVSCYTKVKKIKMIYIQRPSLCPVCYNLTLWPHLNYNITPNKIGNKKRIS